MDRSAPRQAPPRHARRLALLGVAVLGLAGAAFVVRRPLLMSAPACLAGRWHGCWDTFNGVVLMTLVALPAAALVVWAMARRRRAAGVPSAWRRSLAEVGMVYGTLPFIWLVLMPGSGAGTVPGRLSLVPLTDLATMGPLGIVGNLLVLAALGFFAPIRFAALASVPRISALAAGWAQAARFFRAGRPLQGGNPPPVPTRFPHLSVRSAVADRRATVRRFALLSVNDVFTGPWRASSIKRAEPMYGVDSDRDATGEAICSRAAAA